MHIPPYIEIYKLYAVYVYIHALAAIWQKPGSLQDTAEWVSRDNCSDARNTDKQLEGN